MSFPPYPSDGGFSTTTPPSDPLLSADGLLLNIAKLNLNVFNERIITSENSNETLVVQDSIEVLFVDDDITLFLPPPALADAYNKIRVRRLLDTSPDGSGFINNVLKMRTSFINPNNGVAQEIQLIQPSGFTVSDTELEINFTREVIFEFGGFDWWIYP